MLPDWRIAEPMPSLPMLIIVPLKERVVTSPVRSREAFVVVVSVRSNARAEIFVGAMGMLPPSTGESLLSI